MLPASDNLSLSRSDTLHPIFSFCLIRFKLIFFSTLTALGEEK
jgi:hypothetical protein